MILIFGGAYQGKADFAKRTFGLEDEDIFYCGESSGQKGLAQESGELPALSPQAEGKLAVGLNGSGPRTAIQKASPF